jgi:transposase
MDMWKAFRSSTLKAQNAPQATILYDKFHVLRHLQDAMDKVRNREYAHLSGQGRRFIKGQRFALLSRWRNLTLPGKRGLRLLFHANKRL